MNARDDMSSIVLYFLARFIGVIDDDFSFYFWSARNQSSLAAGIDVEVLPLYIIATGDVLSHKLPMCLNFISSTTYSRTIHPRTNPNSLISFIVNLPFGFV